MDISTLSFKTNLKNSSIRDDDPENVLAPFINATKKSEDIPPPIFKSTFKGNDLKIDSDNISNEQLQMDMKNMIELQKNIQVSLNEISVQLKIFNTKINIRPIRDLFDEKYYVKIKSPFSNEIFEFKVEKDKDLEVESVMTMFPYTIYLKYLTITGTFKICKKNGSIFQRPDDGWGNRIYEIYSLYY